VKTLVPIPASRAILEKIEDKHGIDFGEIEDLFRRPHVVLRSAIDSYGERWYVSLGRTDAGRYLFIVFAAIAKTSTAKVITARDMMERERRYYARATVGRRRR
jgi:uncharacterized DUF497 family protein